MTAGDPELTSDKEVVTATGYEILAGSAAKFSETYAATSFVQLDGVVPASSLRTVVERAVRATQQYACQVVHPPEIGRGSFRDGKRFSRVDYGDHEHIPLSVAEKAAVREAFVASGLSQFIERLVEQWLPFVEDVAQHRLRFDRCFLLCYREGDLIAPHGDSQTSRRVMLQMPVTDGCRTVFRVLQDGWLRPFYDDPGTLRILGPGVWHDVPPVVASSPGASARRIVVTARLPYMDE